MRARRQNATLRWSCPRILNDRFGGGSGTIGGGGEHVKPLWIGVLLAVLLAWMAAGQSNPARPDETIRGDRIVREAGVVRATGHVRIHVDQLMLMGSEGSYRTETEEAEVRGNASITLAGRADRHLIRYGSGRAVVTGEAVTIEADRIDVKNGLLRADGHVRVITERNELKADEMFLYLRIGDAEVRGNVLLNGGPLDAPGNRFGVKRSFPPEIMK